MRLTELIAGLKILNNISEDPDISHVSYNSENIQKGSLFVAIKGQKFDGHDFIKDAINKGAVAFVVERPEIDRNLRGYQFLVVDDTRKALAIISSNFFGRVSEKIPVIGVTGTNGKTTTSFLIKSILNSYGLKTGLIGTIHYEIGNTILPATHTTPESVDFQELLRKMYDAGCEAIVTEVSSHALALKRVDGTVFERAVFTNLSRDHLDFHGTMEDYFQAKARLFKKLLREGAFSIINADDEYGMRLKSFLGKTITYGIISGDVRAININNSITGLDFDVIIDGQKTHIESSLTGLINVYNILGAISIGISMNIPLEIIRDGIRNLSSVKGRFQKIGLGQDFLVVVDYAHTPDALKRLIITARELITQTMSGEKKNRSEALGKIITVFGCGGDRDRGKRPLMGEIATKLSDFVIITNDNPRTEDPNVIISDILKGVIGENFAVIPDRFEAIRQAVRMAEKGDVVLIAGKGHEEYQEIKGQRFYFSDEDAAKQCIKERLTVYAST